MISFIYLFILLSSKNNQQGKIYGMFFPPIILRFLFYANTVFALLSPLVSTCLFSESRVHVSGEEWALSWDGGLSFISCFDENRRQEKQMYQNQRTLQLWSSGWRGCVGYCLRAVLCTGHISVTMGSMFHSWSITAILALKWGLSGVKIITKQISSVAVISSISMISCFLYLVPQKKC